MKDKIRETFLNAGAVAVGFAAAGAIDKDVAEGYERWIKEGYHGEMSYLERHVPLKLHTDSVLPCARTVISLAFGYKSESFLLNGSVASYAYVEDYHLVVREKLKPVLNEFEGIYGGKWRLCIDSAPIAERYWGVKSGIGRRGVNGSIIVDKCGSFCFLAEILTTVDIEPDKASGGSCRGCGACVKFCPGNAIKGDGTIDARRCVNYLTIEKSGDFDEEDKRILQKTGNPLYGCDICLRVCPENREIKSISNRLFKLHPSLALMRGEKIIGMNEAEFKECFNRSPLIYAGYSKLKRNASISLIKRK